MEQSKPKPSCIDSNNVRDSGHEDNTSSVATSKTSSNSKDVSIEKIERTMISEVTLFLHEENKLPTRKQKQVVKNCSSSLLLVKPTNEC